MGAKLTGHHRSFEVQPFSYREYLEYTGRTPGDGSFWSYLDDGGFPTYLRERDANILRGLQRDIASRYGLCDLHHLMNLALFLLANTGQPFSLQRLTKFLSVPTVGQTSRYVGCLQDPYLLIALPKFSPSFRKRVVSPNKYYAVDNGLRIANSPQAPPTSATGWRMRSS